MIRVAVVLLITALGGIAQGQILGIEPATEVKTDMRLWKLSAAALVGASVADMAAYSRQEDLNTIPSWHFFTGPTPALKNAWRDYNIAVEAPNPDTDIVHTSALYFIDAQGREAFLASPMVDHTKKGTAYLPAKQVAQWATGIALIAHHLATQAG